MNKREIFYLVSLACLGVFILIGIYLWQESNVYSREMEFNREYYAKQAEELAKKETNNSPSPAAANSPGASTSKPAAPASPGPVAQPPPPAAAPKPAPAANTNIIPPGCKVGDVVKMGDLEMVVTKATNKHKVIDITITGNKSGQPPKPILVKPNRIVYEIPANVDLNVDLTEKTIIEKSSVFYNNQK